MTVADGLRPDGLDVRRHGPGPGDPRQGRRHDPRPPEEPGHEQAAALGRLPRQPGRLERRDDLDRPGRGEALRVEGRLRRRVDVPLRHVAGAPPHRQRHVRHGHRRAEGGPPPVDTRVRARPERVVPRPAGRARRRSTKAAAAAPAPDFVVFNGVANQYVDHPIEVGDRRAGARLRPQRRPVDRQLVPRRRHDLRHGHQGGRPARAGQRRQLGLAGGRPRRRPRARSSSSRCPRTACIRWSPTPSTSSGAARSACSRPATATRSTDGSGTQDAPGHRAGLGGGLLRCVSAAADAASGVRVARPAAADGSRPRTRSRSAAISDRP